MAKKINYKSLNVLNMSAAGLHLIQAILIIYLSKDFTLPVTAGFLSFDPINQSLNPASEALFEFPLAWLVTTFFFLSFAAHFIIATIWRKKYEKNLKLGMNPGRWIEYSLSASTMMVAIAMLVGIYEVSQLIMIFALVAIMNLCGLIMEVHNQTTSKTNWLSYWIGCLAGIVPWVAVGLYFWASNKFGGGTIPDFVYWIYVSIFIFFNCFAINMLLQYKKVGPWRDYLYGERAYIILSLVAKSLLAWQVFAGTLRP